MMRALESHFIMFQGLSQKKATAKAKALVVGMTSSQFAGWSWPEPTFLEDAKPSYPRMAVLTAGQAVELQDDLVKAFSADAFQSKLQALRQEPFADCAQFAAAMRDTAMVAQKVVLRKHSFPESVEGVKEMTTALAAHLVAVEAISQKRATTKAKGLMVGMAASQLAGWSWPEFVEASLPEVKKVSQQDDDSDDAVSTDAPASYARQVSGDSEEEI